MKVSLVVLNAGKTQGQAIPVTLAQFIIGRDPQCNLRPASAVISKRHCAVLVKKDQVFVRDFESTNGTFINDIQVKGEVPIKNDDVLKVGPLSFKVVIEARPGVTKPTPVPAVKPAGSADEDVAAMLLSLGEDGTAGVTGAVDDFGVPSGSTVMDVVPLNMDKPPDQAPKPPEKKEAKKDAATAHLAAKQILDKYTRRPRT